MLLLSTLFLFAALDDTLATNSASNRATQISQTKIDALSEAQRELFMQYREELREIETLKTYNAQLRSVIAAQNEEMESLNLQIVEIEVTQQRILPLMEKMIGSLEQFIALDAPFLTGERSEREARLKTLLSRANLTVSQKYRAIIEAYGIEMEYGRTIEAYDAPLGEKESVEYLRIGRTALYYLTRDETELGIYNPNTREFVPLKRRYLGEIKKGIRIARKQLAPELLQLPVIATKVN